MHSSGYRWAVLSVLLILAVASAAAAPLSNIYFVGDSLSDAGNVSAISGGTFPPPPYFSGRVSSGPVWAERFASSQGKAPDGQAAGANLGPLFGNQILPGIPGGRNYAIGGARNGLGGLLDAFGVPSGINWQIGHYLMQAGGVADPNALYVLFGGSQDIRESYALAEADRPAALGMAAGALGIGIQTLAAAGAQQFLVLNAPNLGLTPESRFALNNAAAATAASVVYNTALDGILDALELTGLHIRRFDTFQFVNAVFADAQLGGLTYGITNVDRPCLPGIPGYAGDDCSVSLFADAVHPSGEAHRLLSAAVGVPEPSSLLLTAAGLAAAICLRRRAV